MTSFAIPPEIREQRAKVRSFMEEHIYPNEHIFHDGNPQALEVMKDLQAKAKAAGMWAMFIGPEGGGTGTGFLPYAYVNEILGRSPIAPRAFGCAAPDTGNAEILHQFGTEEQKSKWLEPLVAGDIRSCFSMTEPEVSGADPTDLQTRAVRDGDEWVITGHKWFTSGAIGATFAIVMCVSDPDAEPHRRMSQIIVPLDTLGVNIVRPVPVMGHTSGAHCEIRYQEARVPVTNVLGEPGDGFRIAQRRLGPGRIHHCMRWLGRCSGRSS
jgi:alkylation response protein AidB-like acyl-CoA dehydrogenase